MDIETYIKDDIMIPFVISWYDGEIKWSYFIEDYKNSEELIKTALQDIMIKKYNNLSNLYSQFIWIWWYIFIKTYG